MIKKAKPPVYSSSQSITATLFAELWVAALLVGVGIIDFTPAAAAFPTVERSVCAVGKRPKRLLCVTTMWDILLARGCRGVNLSPLFP